MGGRGRFVTPWLAVLVLAASLWWGLHPPRTEDAYRRESASTAELLRSDVETAKLWLEASRAGKVTSAAAEVALAETETAAGRRASSYASYQPPTPASTALRAEVTSLADQVVSMLGEVRVDARAGRWDDAYGATSDLARLSERLRDLQERVAP